MIKSHDVITMKLPFPNISSGLAVKAHMYICENVVGNDYCFIKCQSFKNRFYQLNHYLVEEPNSSRNPFVRTSLIDCDKRFNIKHVLISEDILTKSRRDVSAQLFQEIKSEIDDEECVDNEIDRIELNKLNGKIKLI
ncbi:hypothetical protein [Lactobacillus sp. W8093]|uniref:hypothetical protein n=1 Tax=Lactobacillus sp. W8093 TaxID=2751038 RepID=UPI0018EFC58C|nr:hypothetical protein [Lactobacillus sp. W8093]MBI0110742.1 hypothetical protein [Lactobacillus sp. W8093]